MAVIVDCDLRHLFGDARDQEARPTCLAFAASDAHAAARPGWQPLSCEYAYYHALRYDGGAPDEGATLEGMMMAIENDGQPHEDRWPYLSELPEDLTQWQPPTDVGQLFRRISKKKPITDLYPLLDSGTPALVAMSISDAFYTPNDEGVVDSNEPVDPVRLHAVIAAGYGTDGNGRLVLVRNSWGDSWGLDGYAWLAESYLMPRLIALASMKESS